MNGTFAGGYYTVSSGHLTNNAYDLTTLTLFVGFNDRANHGELLAPTWNVGDVPSGDDWNNYTLFDNKHPYPNEGVPNFYGRYRWMDTDWYGAYDYAIFLKYDSSRRLINTHVYYKGGSNILTLPSGYMATPYTYFRDQDGSVFRQECTYVGNPVNMDPVTKNGYTFLGWSWENNGNITTSNITRWNDGSYYAQWMQNAITL